MICLHFSCELKKRKSEGLKKTINTGKNLLNKIIINKLIITKYTVFCILHFTVLFFFHDRLTSEAATGDVV